MSTPITTAIGRVQPLYRGEYDSSLNYDKLDHVLYDGCTYVALKNVPAGQVPGSASSSYWQLIAEKGNTGGFGTPTASASSLAAGKTPTIKITSSGPDTAKIFNFKFGIPAGPTGPIGFDTISAGASALPVGANPTVTVTRTETSGNINVDFQFGIPAAEGQGAIAVDNVGLDQNRNINLTAVRAVQSQGLSTTQQEYARSNIGAVPTSRTINGKNLNSNITLAATDIGAVPTSRTINSKNLNSNVTLTAADVNAVPTSRTINSKALNSDITLTPADIGAVPTGRTINSKNLNSNITLAAADVGAVPTSRTVNSKSLNSNITLTATDVNAVPTTRTINSKALSSDITLAAADVNAVPTSRTINGKALNSDITISTVFESKAVASSLWTTASVPTAYANAGYTYRAKISSLTGVTTNMVPIVVFDLADSVSGKFAPIAESASNAVYIYANEKPSSAITIPTIICISK